MVKTNKEDCKLTVCLSVSQSVRQRNRLSAFASVRRRPSVSDSIRLYVGLCIAH